MIQRDMFTFPIHLNQIHFFSAGTPLRAYALSIAVSFLLLDAVH